MIRPEAVARGARRRRAGVGPGAASGQPTGRSQKQPSGGRPVGTTRSWIKPGCRALELPIATAITRRAALLMTDQSALVSREAFIAKSLNMAVSGWHAGTGTRTSLPIGLDRPG